MKKLLLALLVLALLGGGGFLAFGGYRALRVKRLLFDLDHWDPEIHRAAQTALIAEGERILPKIYEFLDLSKDEAERRIKAYWILERIKTRLMEPAKLIPKTFREALRDGDHRIVWGAMRVLYELNDKDAIQDLVDLLGKETLIQEESLKVLRRWADRDRADVLKRLNTGARPPSPKDRRLACVSLLGEIADADSIATLQQAAADEEPAIRRLVTVFFYTRFRDPALVLDLINRMDSKQEAEADVRLLAAFGLMMHRDPRGLRPFIDALDDPDDDVRKTALLGLGRLGAKEALEPVLARVNDKDPEVVWRALYALAHLPDEDHKATAMVADRLMKDPEVRTTLFATYAIARFYDPNGAKALLQTRERQGAEHYHVRKNAVIGLSTLENPETVIGVMAMTDDSELTIRRLALVCLGLLANRPVLGPETPQEARAREEVVIRAYKVLQENLKDGKDPGIIINAIWSATLFRRKELIPELLRLLAHEDVEVRSEAYHALLDLTYKDPPIGFVPEAPKEERDAAVARWNAWWNVHGRIAAWKVPPAKGPLLKFQDPKCVEYLIQGFVPPRDAKPGDEQARFKGLRDDDRELRKAAIQNLLNAVPHPPVGYHYDAPPKEREAAVKEWEAWWERYKTLLRYDPSRERDRFVIQEDER